MLYAVFGSGQPQHIKRLSDILVSNEKFHEFKSCFGFSIRNKSLNFNVIRTRFLKYELSLWDEITIRYHFQSWLYHDKCGLTDILKAFS